MSNIVNIEGYYNGHQDHDAAPCCSVAVAYVGMDLARSLVDGRFDWSTFVRSDGGLFIPLVRFYQEDIKPKLISEGFGARCQFNPSCSEYALEAARKYGEFRGSILTLGRLARCNPHFNGGYNPVR
ncbi:MAG: membrane protein insertion efficiency factor YidD [Nanoarchaeota archaeon]|nr:membrane protein insertion efficiency factor YidD [Nanoarchaeota archaeon]